MNPTQMQVDLAAQENIICDSCDNKTFEPVFVIKRISPLISPNGEETLVPLQVFKCVECDHINELFLEGITN